MSENKIVIKNINKVFNIKNKNESEKSKFDAICNVNLTVRKGEFITIVGPSGCGKSTLLDIIAGLSDPTSGEIYRQQADQRAGSGQGHRAARVCAFPVENGTPECRVRT